MKTLLYRVSGDCADGRRLAELLVVSFFRSRFQLLAVQLAVADIHERHLRSRAGALSARGEGRECWVQRIEVGRRHLISARRA